MLRELLQLLVGLHRALEETREDADLVVERTDAVERDVDAEIEIGTRLQHVLDDLERADDSRSVGRDADVPDAGVLVEDLDDLTDVLAEEGLAPGRQEKHKALPHAGGDLVDLFERELLLLNCTLGVSQPGCAPSARRQCLHFALQASAMKYTMYAGIAPFFENILPPPQVIR